MTAVIENIRHKIAFAPQGISAKKVNAYQKKLADSKLPNIPLGYTRFLTAMNGLSADNLVLFGLDSQSPENDIMANNALNSTNKEMIFLGYDWDEYLCFSWSQKAYLILSRRNPDVITHTFPHCDMAIEYMLREYL